MAEESLPHSAPAVGGGGAAACNPAPAHLPRRAQFSLKQTQSFVFVYVSRLQFKALI